MTSDQNSKTPKNLTRRSFLKASSAAVAAGAAGSFALAGCTPKEEPRTTAVEPLDSDVTQKFSFCGICSANCAMVAEIDDNGRAVQLKGNPDDQVAQGKLCVKGYAALKDLYDPDRLKYPMKRTNPEKGPGVDPGWTKISWEEAYKLTADEFNKARENHGPESIAFFSRGHPWMNRLREAIGTPNHIQHHSTCFTTYTAIWRACVGTGNRPFMLDVANSNYLLSFGWDMPSKAKNMSARDYVQALQKGAKSVVVDPKLTVTATLANEWVPIKPGTDLAFMLAMINVILDEDLYDHEFVNNYTQGIEELREAVKEYTPSWAEDKTDVPAGTIYRISREFATNKPALIPNHKRDAGGPNHVNSWRAAFTILILNSLVGSMDREGGQIIGRTPSFDVSFNSLFPAPDMPSMRTDRIDGFEKHPIIGPTRRGDFSTVTDAILTEKPYPLKAALVRKHNVLAFPDAVKSTEALKKLDFLAVIDIWPSEMVQMADVVFPESYFLETWGMGNRSYFAMYPQIALREPIIEPLHDTKGYGGIIEGIAQEMGLGHYFANVSGGRLRDEQLKSVGSSWEELTNSPNGLWSDEKPFTPRTSWPTDSGKIELYSNKLKEAGYDPLPYWQPKREMPSDDYPFYMIISRPGMHKMSQTQNNYLMLQEYPENFVIMNTDKAHDMGISHGQELYVESRAGKIKLKAHLTNGIRPDCVCVEHGFGHWSQKLSLAYQRGANEGDLIPRINIQEMLEIKDPGAGSAMNDFCVRVYKA
ncbi:molybdopterin-dependent oxidoreductase [Desulfonatronospira sp.]|uniref:molybdopterin-containing oxidoreductase family protein n=1 Tax=Desulfonatronospira sp. TaxID=1962951 RepID=UPI0025BCB67B|nr:molybdopterin-dependent oxidoreductase [Desulfonatronospira sp.]